ncbi:MAG: right-handed parallel beta-helix repeat-containing protein [Bacteroidales bacterium]|nr:right-handed parallel beta-helix repeat-containing protein [Bacteroidales bacterium]
MKHSTPNSSKKNNLLYINISFILLSFLTFCFTTNAEAQDYPRARFFHAITADESNLYIFGGFEATDGRPGQQGMTGDYELGNSFWAFAFDALGWTNLSSDTDPDVRCGHSMELLGDGNSELTLFGGKGDDEDNYLRDTWRGDCQAGGWEDAHATGCVPVNLANYASAVLGGEWYISGGYQKYNSSGTLVRGVVDYTYKYIGSSNSWECLSCQNTPPGVQRGSGFSYGGRFWLYGGYQADGTISDRLVSLDPETNTWTDHTPANPGNDWPEARYDQQAVVLGDELHITAGYGVNSDLTDHWVYDLLSGECTKQEDVPEEVQLRHSKAVAGPGGTIYYFGGEKDNEPLDNFYKLEEGEKWSKFDKQGKRWRRVGGTTVFLNMQIEPGEAADNGCNVIPNVGEHEYEEGAEVELSAIENAEKGWYFLNWTGVPGGSSKTTLVTMDSDKDAVAHFKEVKLLVTGRVDTIFCRCDIEELPKIVNLTRMTALGDDWMVNSLTINALEGSGDEVNQVNSVFVTFGNNRIAEGHFLEDDGSVTLTLDPAISIPENETFTVTIHYEFKNITQEVLEEEVLIFRTDVNAHGSPVHYENGLIEGKGKGFVWIGRVWSYEKNIAYPSIGKALSASFNSNATIMLCPEEFHENVYFGSATYMLTPERFGEKRATIIGGGDDAPTITLTGESANFKRIIFKSTTDNCIATSAAYDDIKNLSLESCSLLSGSGFNSGLSLLDLKNLIVKNCDFQGGFSGIFSAYSSKVSIDDCHFSNSKVGINLVRCKEITISNSSITSCDLEGVRIFDNSLDYKVALSNVHESNSKYGFAITTSYLSINNCSAKENQIAGFKLHDVSLFSISGCLASFNKTPGKAIGTGIELSGCQYGTISNNHLFQNCSGIKMENTFSIALSGNKISNSTCWNTGINLDNSSPTLKGNKISNNHGAGILATNGAEPIIIGNNIDGNTVGVENQDPTVQLQASGNYWGTNNGPGEEDISGVVNVDEWLNSQVELVASFGADTLFLLPQTIDTITLYLNNLESETDQLQVSWSDEQGWIQGDVRGTVDINDTGGTQEIHLNAPEEDSPANHLAILAQSINEPDRTVRDTVVLVTYHPELSVLTAFPDSVMLKPEDSLQLTATGYDQHNYNFEGEWVWTTTSGTVEPQGLLVCPETEGEITVTLTDRQTGQDTQVRFYCTNEEETVQNILIKPMLDSLVPDMSIGFDLRAWNQFGFPTNCQPEWTCEGGSIDEFGSYTAGDELGWFTITATDPNSGATGTCQVKIVTALGKKQIQINQNILIYPNPANNNIRISNLPLGIENIQITLFNTLGQTALERSFPSHSSAPMSLDIGDLPKGLYFIQIDTNMGQYQARFIKE